MNFGGGGEETNILTVAYTLWGFFFSLKNLSLISFYINPHRLPVFFWCLYWILFYRLQKDILFSEKETILCVPTEFIVRS